jgi:hypothetical protein
LTTLLLLVVVRGGLDMAAVVALEGSAQAMH